jgi:alkaline phosphatase
MKEYYGIEDLTDEEVAKIKKAGIGRAFAAVIGPMISARSAIGWIYGGHTGEDLFLYAYGPQKPVGLIENTQIAAVSAKALGFDLKEADKELFVPAEEAFQSLGATLSIDSTNENAPRIFVQKGLRKLELVVNTNIIKIGKDTHKLPGLIVFVPKSQKVYVPKAAINIAKAFGM